MTDLHLHLDGSLSTDVVKELARTQGIILPSGTLSDILSAGSSCSSLEEYLQHFVLPLSLLQNEASVEFAVYSLVKKLYTQGIIYAEIRFAPQLHKGASQKNIVRAAIHGLHCALDECHGINAQLILCCMRRADNEAENTDTVRIAAEFLGNGVCAADLAGAEAPFPNDRFAGIFALARSLCLPFTIHAGEVTGAASIRSAIELGASRIGHGVRLFEDEVLMSEVIARGIPLEMCPTSNLQTHAVPSPAEYPLAEYLRRGVTVTVNTDNMTVSRTTLANEFTLLRKLGITKDEILTLLINSARSAFLPNAEKKALEERIRASLKATENAG